LGLVLGDSSWGSTWLRRRGNNRGRCDSSLGQEGKKKAEPTCEDAGEQFDLAKEIPYKDKSEMTHPDLGKYFKGGFTPSTQLNIGYLCDGP
jgi:hypothetical protein